MKNVINIIYFIYSLGEGGTASYIVAQVNKWEGLTKCGKNGIIYSMIVTVGGN